MSAKTTRSKSQSSAVKRLQVHNQSPEKEHQSRSHSSRHLRSRSPVLQVHDQTDREWSLDRSDQRGPLQSSNDTSDWAKELLLQQKVYGKELKRLKAELASKPNKAGKHKETDPEFKFEGNKRTIPIKQEGAQEDQSSKGCGRGTL